MGIMSTMKESLITKEMWKQVAKVGWERNNYDYKKIAKTIYSWPEYSRFCLRAFVGNRVDDLYNRVKEWEKDHPRLNIGSDDGFNDVLYHIVGLGGKTFKAAMKNPILIETRYNSKYGTKAGYKESFAYCFHEPEKPSATKNESVPDVIRKITHGWVEQRFDTKAGKYIGQEFFAGDLVEYEDRFGNPVSNKAMLNKDGSEPYLPFDMIFNTLGK